MEERRSSLSEGVALIAIAVAYTVNYFTIHVFYGPVVLLCVGAVLIALSYLGEKEQRRVPVTGILLAALGLSLVIEVLTGGKEVIIAILMPIVVVVTGIKMLFK